MSARVELRVTISQHTEDGDMDVLDEFWQVVGSRMLKDWLARHFGSIADVRVEVETVGLADSALFRREI